MPEAGDERVRAIRSRLEDIAEELADLAIEQLRMAVAEQAGAGGSSAPGARRRQGGPAAEEERRISRARRAVERAAAILSSPEEGSDGDT